MSWVVEGVVYHNAQEYRQAQARANRASVEQRAARLSAELDALRARVVDRRANLGRSGLTLEHRQRLQEEMRTDELRLSAIRREAASSEQQLRIQLTEQALEFEAHAASMGLSVETLRTEQKRHAEELAAQLKQAAMRLEEAATAAEEARKDGENRLRLQIDEIDARLSAERRERAAKSSSAAARARAQSDVVANTLRLLQEPELERLGLQLQRESCSQSVVAARALADADQESAAVAMSESAAVALTALEREASRRKGALEVRRDGFAERVKSAASRLQSPEVAHWFRAESDLLERASRRLAEKIEASYQRFDRLEAESLRDEEFVREIEARVEDMVSVAPALEALEPEREKSERKMLELLQRNYGEITEINEIDTYTRHGDPKTNRRWTIAFGASRVILEVGLDGSVRVDGHGYSSNSECASAAERVIRDMRNEGQLSNQSVDSTNRLHASPATLTHARDDMHGAIDRLASRIG